MSLNTSYIPISGPFVIVPDTDGVTDLTPGNARLRNINVTGTVTAAGFVGPGGGPVTLTSVLIQQGVIAAQALGLQQTVTWNNAAVTFIAQQLNITDTASASISTALSITVNATQVFSVNKFGAVVTVSGVIIGASQSYSWNARSKLLSSADGQINLTNNAGTGFSRLTFGPETSSFPSLKVNGAQLQIRLGDDTGYGSIVTSVLVLAMGANSQPAGLVAIGNATQTTVGAAGAASALPITPSGYLKFYIGPTGYVFPYYAQA